MHEPLFAFLRHQTRDAHRRLESARPLQRLMARDYSRAEYADLLGRLAAFFGPVERRLLESAHGAARRCGYRARTPAILADLELLGRVPEDLPGGAPMASLADLPSEVGCLYVLEGSRLGGRVIARQIGGPLGLTPRRGLRFFAGDDASGRGWRRFQERAQPLCPDAGASAGAAASARSVFALLHGWLSGEAH